MKNLFKFVCVIAFLTGGLVFGQTKPKPKPDIKVVYCKKFTVSVSIKVLEIGTELTGCLIKVDGLPIMVWLKQAQNQSNNNLEYLYVEEEELIRKLNLKDSKDLENMKIIESGVWDYEGKNYMIDSEAKYEVIEIEGIKYYALPIQANE